MGSLSRRGDPARIPAWALQRLKCQQMASAGLAASPHYRAQTGARSCFSMSCRPLRACLRLATVTDRSSRRNNDPGDLVPVGVKLRPRENAGNLGDFLSGFNFINRRRFLRRFFGPSDVCLVAIFRPFRDSFPQASAQVASERRRIGFDDRTDSE